MKWVDDVVLEKNYISGVDRGRSATRESIQHVLSPPSIKYGKQYFPFCYDMVVSRRVTELENKTINSD